jgi:macrolide transport system ATP-binding/permease protein
MKSLRAWLIRLAGLFNKQRRDRELTEELESHLAMHIEDNFRSGMTPEEARRQALIKLGGLEQTKEIYRDRRGLPMLETLIRDLHYGARMLAKNPGFTVVAILSLSLGIGANTTIFSLGNALLLRPLPLEEPDRLVSIFTSYAGGDRYGQTSLPDYEDFRDRTDVFTGLTAYSWSPMGLKAGDRTDVIMGQVVTWNYFSVLGVEPHLGRDFLREEDQTPDAHPVAVLSHRMWTSHFGSNRGILGQTVRLNDHPFTIVGIAPEGFHGPLSILAADVWVPTMMAKRALAWVQLFGPDRRRDPFLYVLGRLKPGVSIVQAQKAMEVLAAQLRREYPSYNRGKSVTVVRVDQNRVGTGSTDNVKALFVLLMGVVIVVLAIACFNVANILLARATGRQREMSLRVALGASRGRIVRQLLTESTLLALAAGVCGLLLSVWAFDLIDAWLRTTSGFPLEIDLSLDRRVFGFTLLLSLATGILFGLAPALKVNRTGQFEALRDQGLTLSRTKSRVRIQNGLVVAQIALSLILLISTGLLLRSLQQTLAVDPGFDPDNRLVVPINLNYGQYGEAEGRRLYQQLADRVRSLPGVREAALASFLPLGQIHGHHDIWIDEYDPAPDESMLVKRNMVGPRYFETLGIPILKGRAIDERDKENTKPVAVINETMARRYWPGREPIGRAIRVGRTVYEVVGIARDGKYGSLREQPVPYLCLPMTQHEYSEQFHLVVAAAGDPGSMVAPLRHELEKLDPNLPPPQIVTLTQFLKDVAVREEGPLPIVGASALLALLLAVIGVYGVMSYSVSERMQEIGVRMALGAQRGQILRQVLTSGLKVALLGVGIGLVAAAALSRLWSAYLFGVTPADPSTFVGISLMLFGVALLACYIPARRATRIDPMVALRYE